MSEQPSAAAQGIELDALCWSLRMIDAGLRETVELRIAQLGVHVGPEVRGIT